MGYRIGFGTDFHKLTPGTGFPLGGVFVPCAYTSVGDSDGDVLLHALVDAMLGSFSLGDIGEHYPPASITPNEPSARFVTETLERLDKLDARIINVDCVIDLEQPKLAPYKIPIREHVAHLLSLPLDRVSLKAKTGEGLGPIGQSLAVGAQVAILVKEKADG